MSKRRALKFNIPLILLTLFAGLRLWISCGGDFEACTLQEDSKWEPKIIRDIRQAAVIRARKYFPSPVSELLLGMTIGVDFFSKVPQFKEMLLQTGTIHVVVVSGYNISLVYTLVWAFLGSFYDRTKLVIGGFVALFYAVLSGFDPPVVRSWLMGSVAYLGKFYGHSFPVLRVLIFTGLLMVAWRPPFLFSLSFQLSFLATLSLVLFSEGIERWSFVSRIPVLFREDFVATVAAQVLVWPLISLCFGRVSLISILVNSLILWTVPVATILGGAFLLFFFVGDFLSRVFAFCVYVPLDIFVDAVRFFSKFPFAQVDLEVSLVFFVLYYLVVFVLVWRRHSSV
jgi:competence protein ComEC